MDGIDVGVDGSVLVVVDKSPSGASIRSCIGEGSVRSREEGLRLVGEWLLEP